jgi:hypothetical protein
LEATQAVGIVFAAIGLFYAAEQFRESSNATSAEIGLRFDDRFRQPEMIKIESAVESVPTEPILPEHHGLSSEDQLEQYIANYDALYYLYKQGLVNDLMMWDLFCSDLMDAYSDKEVRTYLTDYRSTPRSRDDYLGFDKLAAICISWNKNGRGNLLDE